MAGGATRAKNHIDQKMGIRWQDEEGSRERLGSVRQWLHSFDGREAEDSHGTSSSGMATDLTSADGILECGTVLSDFVKMTRKEPKEKPD